MLTIMGGIAEFERSLIRSRTDAGIERAKRQGKRFGRPERLDAGQKRVIAELYGRARRSGVGSRVRGWCRHRLEGASTRNHGGGVKG
jgi:DNA invertase Pin-like site-specific DNA recombinase